MELYLLETIDPNLFISPPRDTHCMVRPLSEERVIGRDGSVDSLSKWRLPLPSIIGLCGRVRPLSAKVSGKDVSMLVGSDHY